jgi:hypothetical protein
MIPSSLLMILKLKKGLLNARIYFQRQPLKNLIKKVICHAECSDRKVKHLFSEIVCSTLSQSKSHLGKDCAKYSIDSRESEIAKRSGCNLIGICYHCN